MSKDGVLVTQQLRGKMRIGEIGRLGDEKGRRLG